MVKLPEFDSSLAAPESAAPVQPEFASSLASEPTRPAPRFETDASNQSFDIAQSDAPPIMAAAREKVASGADEKSVADDPEFQRLFGQQDVSKPIPDHVKEAAEVTQADNDEAEFNRLFGKPVNDADFFNDDDNIKNALQDLDDPLSSQDATGNYADPKLRARISSDIDTLGRKSREMLNGLPQEDGAVRQRMLAAKKLVDDQLERRQSQLARADNKAGFFGGVDKTNATSSLAYLADGSPEQLAEIKSWREAAEAKIKDLPRLEEELAKAEAELAAGPYEQGKAQFKVANLKQRIEFAKEGVEQLKHVEDIEQGNAPAPSKTAARAALETIARDFISMGAGGLLKGAGMALNAVGNAPRRLVGAELQDVEDTSNYSARALYQFGEYISDQAQQLFPGDIARQQHFSQKLASGVGSALSFIAGGEVMAAAKADKVIAPVLSFADKYLVPRILSSRVGPLAARGQEARVGVMGAATMAPEGHDEAARALHVIRHDGKETGTFEQPEDYRASTAAVQMALGLTEMAGFTAATKVMSHAADPKIMQRIVAGAQHIAGKSFGEALEEGAQEAFQGTASNLWASVSFDPSRDVFEGVAEQALMGAIVGAGLGGLHASHEAYTQDKSAENNRKFSAAQAVVKNQVRAALDGGISNDDLKALKQKLQKDSPYLVTEIDGIIRDWQDEQDANDEIEAALPKLEAKVRTKGVVNDIEPAPEKTADDVAKGDQTRREIAEGVASKTGAAIEDIDVRAQGDKFRVFTKDATGAATELTPEGGSTLDDLEVQGMVRGGRRDPGFRLGQRPVSASAPQTTAPVYGPDFEQLRAIAPKDGAGSPDMKVIRDAILAVTGRKEAYNRLSAAEQQSVFNAVQALQPVASGAPVPAAQPSSQQFPEQKPAETKAAPPSTAPVEPAAAAKPANPFAFSAAVILSREGEAGLRDKLNAITSEDDLRSLADSQDLLIPDDTEGREQVIDEIVEAAKVRLVNRQTPRSGAKIIERPAPEPVAPAPDDMDALRREAAEVVGPELAETLSSQLTPDAMRRTIDKLKPPVAPQPDAAPAEFDPYNFSPVKVLQDGGEAALRKKLSDVQSRGDMEALALAHGIPVNFRGRSLAKDEMVDELVAGAAKAGKPKAKKSVPAVPPVAKSSALPPVETQAVEAPAFKAGEEFTLVTPDGSMNVRARAVVVEASELRKASGARQPRDRNRQESAIGQRARAAQLDAEQLKPGRVTDAGAPLILPEKEIISGNGRFGSIVEAYQTPEFATQAAAYRAMIEADYPQAKAMREPVLAMEIIDDLSDEEIIRLADLSNRSRIASMSATERAMRDAQAAGPEIMGLYTGGSFTTPENRPFFQAFMDKAVTTAERGEISKDGMLTKQGEDRLSAAVLAAAFGDPDLLARMLESTDDNVRALTGALKDASGALVQLNEAIRLGIVPTKFGLTDDLVDAVKRIALSRQRGVAISAMLAQTDFLNRMPANVETLVRAFYTEDLSRALSRQKITKIILAYVEEAKQKRAEGLFEDGTTFEDVVKAARAKAGIEDDNTGGQSSLFPGIVPDSRGTRDQAGAAAEGLRGRNEPDDGPIQQTPPASSNAGSGEGGNVEESDQGGGDGGTVDAEPVATVDINGLRAKFSEIIDGSTPRVEWADALGGDTTALKLFIDEAVADGRLRRDANGVVRRVAKERRKEAKPKKSAKASKANKPSETATNPQTPAPEKVEPTEIKDSAGNTWVKQDDGPTWSVLPFGDDPAKRQASGGTPAKIAEEAERRILRIKAPIATSYATSLLNTDNNPEAFAAHIKALKDDLAKKKIGKPALDEIVYGYAGVVKAPSTATGIIKLIQSLHAERNKQEAAVAAPKNDGKSKRGKRAAEPTGADLFANASGDVGKALSEVRQEAEKSGDVRGPAEGDGDRSGRDVGVSGGADAGGSPEDGRANDGALSQPREGAGTDTAHGRGNRDERVRSLAPDERRDVAEKVAADLARSIEERQKALAENYVITDDDVLGEGTARQKINANLDAIELSKDIEFEGRKPTEDEKKILVKYTGWGAFAQTLFDKHPKPGFEKEHARLRDLLDDQEMAAAKGSVLNAHYTSPEVIKGMWEALRHLGFTGGRVLEPSAGAGHFIGLQPRDMAALSQWQAVELDKLTGRILSQLYGGTRTYVQGFETVKWPNDFFDLAISNVPFGNYKITDKTYKDRLSIHDYFFVKALDKVRPGGIVAFVTSHYTMDKADTVARATIREKGEFLGAIRLPGGKSGAFAGNAGTAVTTDIIFIRKRVPGQPAPLTERWIEKGTINTPEGPHEVNGWYADNPSTMLGTMHKSGSGQFGNEPWLEGTAEDIESRIFKAAETMDAGAFLPRDTTISRQELKQDTETDGIREGALYKKDGEFYVKLSGVGQPQKIAAKDKAKVDDLLALRDVMNKLLSLQSGDKEKNRTELDALREELNSLYDAFKKKHGPINRVVKTVTSRMSKAGNPIVLRRWPNIAAFSVDRDAPKLKALEIYDEETDTAAKAAIFTNDIIGAYERPGINGPSDALAVTLNETGRIDLPTIAGMLKSSEQEAVALLGDRIYLNPKGDTWETSDAYLSGDVVTKLEDARAAAAGDAMYARNVAALEKIQPDLLTRTDIRVPMGTPWVPLDVYVQFVNEALGGNINEKAFQLNPENKRWNFKGKHGFPPSARTTWGTDRVEVHDIIEAALNGSSITVTDKTREGSEVNGPETEAANNKVQAIRALWFGDAEIGQEAWIWQDDARSERMEALYNSLFNRLVARRYDGQHLTFPGMATTIAHADGRVVPFELRPHQKDAVWRIIQSGNTLLDHEVGLGKTFVMIAAAMEQKRLGLIRRPMIAVPNHMLDQFTREFLQAYPSAKLLVADKESMSKSRRKEFVARVAADNWDSIIITHSAFNLIPLSPETQAKFLDQELTDMERARRAAEDAEGEKSATVKDIEKAKKKLEDRIKALLNAERKDDGVLFEETGVDQVIYDEAHGLKNLGAATRHTRMRGMAVKPSQRAADAYAKIRWLDERQPNRSVVFATGTPMSRSMVELFTMQKFLQKSTLTSYNVDHLDGWLGTFATIQQKLEQAPNGRELRDMSSFKFVNIPELNSLYSLVADTRRAIDVGITRPELKDGKIDLVTADLDKAQDDYITRTIQDMENLKGKRPEKGQPNHLSLFTRGLQAATDLRLVDPTAEFNPTGKIAKCIDNVLRIHKEGKAPALAQLIFLDMGVPDGASSKKKKQKTLDEGNGGLDGLSQIDKVRQGLGMASDQSQDDDADDDAEEVSDGSEAFLEGTGFNLYEDIKQRLINGGIPKNEIAFIHDAKTDDQKGELFRKVRAGEVRVLLGTRPKMGVGTNVQAQLIAIHHIDAPWNPSDVEQADGRIRRQGNKNPIVQIFRYVSKRSFDAYRWQILDSKADFLMQFRAGARGLREAEDIDSPLPEAAEVKAAAADDPLLTEMAYLNKELSKLEGQKREHERGPARARQAITQLEADLRMSREALPAYQADAAVVTDTSGDKFAVTIDVQRKGASFTERKAAGEAIRNFIVDQAKHVYNATPELRTVGTLSGLKLTVEIKAFAGAKVMRLGLEGAGVYRPAEGWFQMTDQSDGTGIIRRFERMLQEVPRFAPNTAEVIEKIEGELPKLRDKAIVTPFQKDERLREVKERIAEIVSLRKPKPQPAAVEKKADDAALNRSVKEREEWDYARTIVEAGGQYEVPDAMVTRALSAPRSVYNDKSKNFLYGAISKIYSDNQLIADGMAYFEFSRGPNLKPIKLKRTWDEIRGSRALTISANKPGYGAMGSLLLTEHPDQLLVSGFIHETGHANYLAGDVGTLGAGAVTIADGPIGQGMDGPDTAFKGGKHLSFSLGGESRLVVSDIDSLVAHADFLGVLDMTISDFSRAINHPSDALGDEFKSLREAYIEQYKDRPDFVQAVALEGYTHMLELINAGFFTRAQIEPVREILEKHFPDMMAFRAPVREANPGSTANSANWSVVRSHALAWLKTRGVYIPSKWDVAAAQNALEFVNGAVPEGTRLGAVTRYEMMPGGEQVRVHFRTTDGVEGSIVEKVSEAFGWSGWTSGSGDLVLASFFGRGKDIVSNNGNATASHEIIHVLRKRGLFDDALWNRLVVHAHDLGVLQVDAKAYTAMAAGENPDSFEGGVTLEDVYALTYADRSDFQEMMDQEAVAVMLEMRMNGYLSNNSWAPAADVFADMLPANMVAALKSPPNPYAADAALGGTQRPDVWKRTIQDERRTIEIDAPVVEEGQAALKRWQTIIPEGVKIGALASVKPVRNAPEKAGFVFKTADGSTFDDVRLGADTFQLRGYQAGDRIGLMSDVVSPGPLSSLGGDVSWIGIEEDIRSVDLTVLHEVSHFLRRTGRLTDAEFVRLADHADKLQVLDVTAAEFYQDIHGITQDRLDLGETLFDDYSDYYRNRAGKDELIAEEAAFHFIEMAARGYFTTEELAPVRDILEAFASGEISKRPATKVQGDAVRAEAGKVDDGQADLFAAMGGRKREVINPRRPLAIPSELQTVLGLPAGVRVDPAWDHIIGKHGSETELGAARFQSAEKASETIAEVLKSWDFAMAYKDGKTWNLVKAYPDHDVIVSIGTDVNNRQTVVGRTAFALSRVDTITKLNGVLNDQGAKGVKWRPVLGATSTTLTIAREAQALRHAPATAKELVGAITQSQAALTAKDDSSLDPVGMVDVAPATQTGGAQAKAKPPGAPPPTAAGQPTPPPAQPQGPVRGLSDLTQDLIEAMGIREVAKTPLQRLSQRLGFGSQYRGRNLTKRLGRLNPGLKAAAARAGGKLAGQYSPVSGVARISIPNDFPALVHEGGHHLENMTATKVQLSQLKANHGGALSQLASPGKNQVSEGFAEWFRFYITEPSRARAAAPMFYVEFEDMIDTVSPAMLEDFQAIQAAWDGLNAAPLGELTKSRTKSIGSPSGFFARMGVKWSEVREQGLGNKMHDAWFAMQKTCLDKDAPLKQAIDVLLDLAQENLALNLKKGERIALKAIDDPYKLARLHEHSRVWAMTTLQYGVKLDNDVDPSTASVYDALAEAFGSKLGRDWDQERFDTFGAYLVARRMVEEWDRYNAGNLADEPDSLMTETRWRDELSELEAQNPTFIRASAMLDSFNKGHLRLKYENGFMDRKLYLELKARENYAPLQRIMDNGGAGGASSSRNKQPLIKRFKGSTRDFINPVEAIIQDVFSTQQRISINRIIRSLDRVARAAGPGGGSIAERIPAKDLQATQIDVVELLKTAAKQSRIDPADAQMLYDTADQLIDQNMTAFLFKTVDTNEKGERIVYLWERGERVPIRLGDDEMGRDIFDTFAAFGEQNSNFITNLFAAGAGVVREGVTKQPAYILVNWLRDQVSTGILSEDFTPFVTGYRGARLIWDKSPWVQRYGYVAGLMGGVSSNTIEMAKQDINYKGIAVRGVRAAPTRLRRAARAIEVGEFASRLGHFKSAFDRAIADGFAPNEAMFEAAYSAHDVMDFSRRGSALMTLTRMVPFFNAKLQGLSVLARTLSGDRDRGTITKEILSPYLKGVARQPLAKTEQQRMAVSAKAWIKMVSYGLILLLLYANWGDDEASEYLAGTHTVLNTPFGIIRIPKAFELGSFGNLFEAAYDYWNKNDPTSWSRFMASVRYTFGFPVSNVASMAQTVYYGAKGDKPSMNKALSNVLDFDDAAIPFVELYYEMKYNYDGFRKKPIVSDELLGLDPELQFNAYTSEFGKRVGKTMGWSPAMVDHFMLGMTASLGRDFLGFSNGLSSTRPDLSLEDTPIVSRFMRRQARGSRSVSKFYDMMANTGGEFTSAAKSYKDYLDKGNDFDSTNYLNSLSDDRKAFAILDVHFEEKLQQINPLVRAQTIMGTISGLRKQMVLDGLTKQESKPNFKKDGFEPAEKIPLSTEKMRIVNEILEDVSMREARNALIAVGARGWAQKAIMPVDHHLAELKAAAPEVAEELEARLANKGGKQKIYSFDEVRKSWPEAKKRLLDEGPSADLSDLISYDDNDYRAAFGRP